MDMLILHSYKLSSQLYCNQLEFEMNHYLIKPMLYLLLILAKL